MERQISLLKYLFIIHIACVQAASAQSGMGPRVAWQRLDGAGSFNRPPRVASRRWRQMSAAPEEKYEYSYDSGTIDQIGLDSEPLRQGFRGFSRQRVVNRDRGVRYGRFNSDTVSVDGSIILRGQPPIRHSSILNYVIRTP